MLTAIEIEALMKFLNRGGYVLDFSTQAFNTFTINSVGVPLCQKYGLSKGASLGKFLSEANERDRLKLLLDLIEYYEISGCLDNDMKYRNLIEYHEAFVRCQNIIAKIKDEYNKCYIQVGNLKTAFNSDYINAQLDLMLKMQHENPTEAIGKAKELIESCCKTILLENGIAFDKNVSVDQLVRKTFELFEILPENIDKNVKESKNIVNILGSLRNIAHCLDELRNVYGSGHGKQASYTGLQPRHAKLAVGSAVTLVTFIWDSYERYKKK